MSVPATKSIISRTAAGDGAGGARRSRCEPSAASAAAARIILAAGAAGPAHVRQQARLERSRALDRLYPCPFDDAGDGSAAAPHMGERPEQRIERRGRL